MIRKLAGVFFDRDGTLNDEVDYVRTPDDLHLIAGAGHAIHKLNISGFATCMISNQSGIARGDLTEDDLVPIHAKLERELARDKGKLDRIYYCPHHPIHGRVPYNIECECRKPKIGMLQRGAEELGIDLERSFVIGDSVVDMQAGNTANTKTILVLTGYGTKTREQRSSVTMRIDHVAPTIVEAVDYILSTTDGEHISNE